MNLVGRCENCDVLAPEPEDEVDPGPSHDGQGAVERGAAVQEGVALPGQAHARTVSSDYLSLL